MKKVFIFIVFLFLLLYPTPYTLTSVNAAYSCTQSGTPLLNGLASTPNLGKNLVNSSGVCVIDPKAAFAPQLIPTFDNLKSVYYTQAKPISSITKHAPLPSDRTQNDIPMTGTTDHIYYIQKIGTNDGNLTINSNISGSNTGIVFVDGNLNINSSISDNTSNGSGNYGLVFIVAGNINIAQSVTRIDAIIVSSGIICTISDNTANPPTCPAANVTSPKLIINGSLISIYKDKPQIVTCSSNPSQSGCPIIKFRRVLVDNTTQPSEQINLQIKYLIILRHLFSDTFQRWSETQ